MKVKVSNANFPMDQDGATYHLGLKAGQVANRIITCGDVGRLDIFSSLLDLSPEPYRFSSARGFTTVTGRYRGVPVSIISIGMGISSIDFMVRETRAVIRGDMAIVRLGSCGSLTDSFPVGAVGVPEQAMMITTNYAYEGPSSQQLPYHLSRAIPGDRDLHLGLKQSLDAILSPLGRQVRQYKIHASADCFYSSQGRTDPAFNDSNQDLLQTLKSFAPEAESLEMETGHLFYLASIATGSSIRAAAAHMCFAGRLSQEFIDPSTVAALEPACGQACLDAIVKHVVTVKHPDEGSVWALP